jgi:hypothetical protein
MPELVALSGKVSGVLQVHAAHASSAEGRGRLGLRFQVAQRPAWCEGTPNVGDGDLVTVAGFYKEGTLAVLAIRNRSTGVDYGGASAGQYTALGVALLCGALTLGRDGIGLLFFLLAGWVWLRLRRRDRALALVRTATPRGSGAAPVTGSSPAVTRQDEGPRRSPAQREQAMDSGRSSGSPPDASP